MEKNKTKVKLRRAKTPDNKNRNYTKNEILIEYIKLNKQSFQFLQNKNFALAKVYFSKTIEISKEIDHIKYIESLINYSLCLYYNNEILLSYNSLKNAYDLSSVLYEKSEEINQIYFIHLRILCNMCLISMNLNKISESQKLFKQIISLIKEPKIPDIKIQITMLRELIYIFYRIDSLKKFQEINDKNENDFNDYISKTYNSINKNIKLDDKGLYYLYKSLKNNDLNYWLNYLNKELNKNNIKDINGYIWLLINRIIVLYYNNNEGNNDIIIKNDLNTFVKIIENNLDIDCDNIDINNNLNKIIINFKNKLNIAIQFYHEISNIENELQTKLNESSLKNKNSKSKENKILIKLLLKNSIKNLNGNNQNNNIIKNQIETALILIENNKINWELLSILNINKDLIKSIKTLFHNLLMIRIKFILRYYFHKYKQNTLGYISLKHKLKNRYIKSETYLKNQLQSLEEGSLLTKINFTSKGYNEHFFRISLIDNEYYFCVHKKISEIKPYKVFNLEELYDITIGIQTDNLKNKIDNEFMNEFKPWGIMSLWFEERTYDLYFDNDEEMNKWFEAIYYYNKYIMGKNMERNLSYFFFNKLKLKMLYKLKNVENDLPIIEQLKYYSNLNEFEYYSLPFPKTIVLYLKVYEKIDE